MTNVQVIQRNAHLAGSVKLEFVNGRDGKTAKVVLTAISNTRRGRRDVEDGTERRTEEKRIEEATVLQWTLWGKQAENAAAHLGKGSHVNIVGRLKNNNYLDRGGKVGEDIHGWAFTVEEIDYLDTRAAGEARRDPLAGEDARG